MRLDRPEIAADLRQRREEGETLVLAPQCAVEAWVVATWPVERNGLGLSTSQAAVLIDTLDRLSERRAEPPGTYDLWRQTVEALHLVGVRAHDARLAAYASAAGVDSVLTLNPSDFAGPAAYLGRQVVHAGRAE